MWPCTYLIHSNIIYLHLVTFTWSRDGSESSTELDCIDASGEEGLSLVDDKFSPIPLASCFASVAKAAIDESTLVSLGLVCALRWVEVFESNCIAQNVSENSLRILGLILEELDEGLLLLSFVKFRRTRKKYYFLDLDPLQWRSRAEDRLCAKNARSSAEVPRVVNLQHCSVEPLERW